MSIYQPICPTRAGHPCPGLKGKNLDSNDINIHELYWKQNICQNNNGRH
jgi:hypothetical protein